MKANPTQDPIFGEGSIREDGRHMHDMFLMEVNAPDKAQYEGDYFTALATNPAEKAFRPLDEGGCPLVTQKPQAPRARRTAGAPPAPGTAHVRPTRTSAPAASRPATPRPRKCLFMCGHTLGTC